MSTCTHTGTDQHEFDFDDEEFHAVMKALTGWVQATKARRPTQSDQGESMAKAFEQWVTQNQPELAACVKCDAEIYSIAVQAWADEDDDDDSGAEDTGANENSK
jgi:hypothetical protein